MMSKGDYLHSLVVLHAAGKNSLFWVILHYKNVENDVHSTVKTPAPVVCEGGDQGLCDCDTGAQQNTLIQSFSWLCKFWFGLNLMVIHVCSISRCCKPDCSPTQHDTAGRKRPEPGGVEVQEGTDTGKSHRLREKTQGEWSAAEAVIRCNVIQNWW